MLLAVKAEAAVTHEKLQQSEAASGALAARERHLAESLDAARTEHRTVLANIREQHGQTLAEAKERYAAAMQAEQAAAKKRLQQREAKVEALAGQLKQTLQHVKATEESQRRTRAEHKAALAEAEAAQERERVRAVAAEERLNAAVAASEAAQGAAAQATAELAEAQQRLAASEDEVVKLEQHLAETVTHIGTMKGRMEDLEESLEVVLARLQVAVDKGAVPPIRPSEIKALGIGVTPRGQVKVSIPHVMTRQAGSSSRQFHVYCIFVTVGHEQWTVERRYSELLAFHQEIRRQLPGAEAIVFPPKVTLGNRNPRLAEERRDRLQTYLQAVVSLAVSLVGTPVQQDPCRETLLLTLPFLGEDAASLAPLPDFDDDYVHVSGSTLGTPRSASPQ